MSKTKGFSALTIIILLAILAGGGYWMWQKQTVTPPSALPEGEGTSTSPLGGGLEGVEGWKTYRNDQYGFEFKYPGELATKYTTAQDWPPTAEVKNATFSCDEGETMVGPNKAKIIKRNIKGREFCVLTSIEGASGLVYWTYVYTTLHSGKLVSLNFVLKKVSCGVFGDDRSVECRAEKSLDTDTLVSEILSTFQFAK